MSWSDILSQVFFAAIVTGLTGDVMFLVWFLCRKFLQNWNPKLAYYMLKWVVVIYLLPIAYCGMLYSYKRGYVQLNHKITTMMFVVDLNHLFFQGMAIIWFMVTLVIASKFVWEEIVKHQICKNNFIDNNALAQAEFERIKEELGIKGKVELLCNDNARVKSPFVTGIIKRKIVIPYGDYTREELKVIFYHEFQHIKKKDIVFRYLTMLAITVNSMNIIAYLLLEQVMIWSEADCDDRTLDRMEKYNLTVKGYYDVLFDMLEEDHYAPDLFYYPMLISASESLYKRMEIMQKYRTGGKRIAKSVTVALTVVFAMLSTVTAHAAGVGMAEINDVFLEERQEILLDEPFGNITDWSEEMLVETSDDIEVVYIDDEIMTRSGSTFSWTVPVGTRYVTKAVYLTKGTEVQIACTATPMDCTYWFGLMYPSSTCNVVEGSGAGSHTFTVPSNGSYHIMVENRGSVELNVSGSYQY